ncbi:MAG: hypothetical protein H6724_10210 [Sandaracinus sp.]|nr:hypothetical protein [Sandaracinus sp.]
MAFLGVYPAAAVAPANVGERRMNLPVRVERTSFELGVSASANELDDRYLGPLGLDRASILTLDLMPYFLANTRKSKGRSMATNLREAELAYGRSFGIAARPSPARLVELARRMTGNVERLTDYFARSKAKLLFTLGSEAAAFVRGATYAAVNREARMLFYSAPVELDVLGTRRLVVHLAHPGILMSGKGRASDWPERHVRWCASEGRDVVDATLRRRNERLAREGWTALRRSR